MTTKIILTRTFRSAEAAHGRLRIDGEHVCHTLEHTSQCLPPGRYAVGLHTCRLYRRRLILISGPLEGGPSCPLLPPTDRCRLCPRQAAVNWNTALRGHCLRMRPGNGIHGITDGSILVGTYGGLGFILRGRDAFDAIYDRIRMSAARGHSVELEIREARL